AWQSNAETSRFFLDFRPNITVNKTLNTSLIQLTVPNLTQEQFKTEIKVSGTYMVSIRMTPDEEVPNGTTTVTFLQTAQVFQGVTGFISIGTIPINNTRIAYYSSTMTSTA